MQTGLFDFPDGLVPLGPLPVPFFTSWKVVFFHWFRLKCTRLALKCEVHFDLDGLSWLILKLLCVPGELLNLKASEVWVVLRVLSRSFDHAKISLIVSVLVVDVHTSLAVYVQLSCNRVTSGRISPSDLVRRATPFCKW